ncbi:hypothetical protein [Desulfosporosinus hippei]|uniref:Uncharacterized protein n=1 Tax=Desulfosporosinus hippei DSM 8344 TaxID=1121419 RepID=A0A1G8CIY2_9FIRM|nr:hypothetical protein [Desulfosporosinus hippei]SDH45396.1 hypothetical protein SAMN05443529_113114 [Desulfosporosinus hippei DSM 8344]
MKYIIADAKKQNSIILVSSHEEYAVEAFEWEADGFLLLSVNKDNIKRLLLRVLEE